jgi:nicotinate-nucleotide pyrophosphorylase (carboxylating)
MYHEMPDIWKDLLQAGLKDDGWPWDWTSLGTFLGADSGGTSGGSHRRSVQSIEAKVVAKSDGVWAAEKLVSAVAKFSGQITAKSKFPDGKAFHKGDILVELQGSARDILALERPFLNLAAYVSGIATSTARMVELVRQASPKNPPRVTLTRKTLPGYRDVAIHGVIAGGGFPHRVSLSGGVLIKENHIAAAGGLAQAVKGARGVAPHGLKIEVEVTSLVELQQAIDANADGVLLDNFTPTEVQAALKLLETATSRPFVEVSGGLTEETIASYALSGVNVLSVGALTHSVKVVDLSLLVI